MNYKFLSTCFFIFVFTQLTAQVIPAVVTLNNGNVLQGNLLAKGFQRQQTLRLFVNNSATLKDIPLTDIRQLELNSKNEGQQIFLRYEVRIDTTPAIPLTSRFDSAALWKPATLLLQLMYDGEIDLLRHIDDYDQTHLFVRQKDQTPFELVHKEYLDTSANKLPNNYVALGTNFQISYADKMVPMMNNTYQQQLYTLVKGCLPAMEKCKKVNFLTRDIQLILKQFDACAGNKITKIYADRQRYVNYSVYAGAHKSVPTTKRAFLPITRVSYELNYDVGAMVEWLFARNQYRYAVQLEGGWSNFSTNYRGEFNGITPVDSFTEKNNHLRLNAMYKIGSPGFRSNRFWVGFGPALSFIPKRTITQHRLPIGNNVAFERDLSVKKLSSEVGFGLATGWQKGRLGFQLRGDAMFGVFASGGLDSKERPRSAAGTVSITYLIKGNKLW